MKQATRSLLTLVVLAVVGGAVAIIAWQQESADAATVGGDAERQLFDFDVMGVDAVELTYQGNLTRLELKPEGWVITKPVGLGADEKQVTSLLRSVEGMRARTEFNTPARPETPDDALTGLAAPDVTLIVQAGDKQWKLFKGARSEFNRESYFRSEAPDGETRVGTISPSAATAIQKTWQSFRDKRAIGAHADRVMTLAVTPRQPSDDAIAWEVKRLPPDPELPAYRQTARFETVRPSVGMADSQRILLALKALGRAPIANLITTDHGGSLLPHGLDNPAWRVTLTLLPFRPGVGEPFQRTLLISDVNEEEGTVTVAREDGTWVGTAAKSLVGDIDLSLGALKSKRLFTFDRGRVARLEMQLNEAGHIVLELENEANNDWRMLAPVPARAKAHLVTSLILAFADLVGLEREAEGADVKKTSVLTRTGLLTPQSITFSDKSGDTLGKLLIGKRLEDDAFAMADGGPYIVRIPASRLDTLPIKAEELVDAK